MLGEIEFDEWQCIAELVDNAFDDFTEVFRSGASWPGGFKVTVSLPGVATSLEHAEVVVSDNGRGMSKETLEQAVRAGWSSNDRFDKLGLFGMGFNVSTARLGRRTRVLTTRAGDLEWIGVEIDLDTLKANFDAQDITEPKDDPSEHGTRVEISHLVQDRADWLKRNTDALRTMLGRVYSWLLDNRPYELWVQGAKVAPRRPCRWGNDRFVVRGAGSAAEVIPAYIEIDEQFEPADACDTCGNWQTLGKARCDQCGSASLSKRERRLHGWLGVQRHLDRQDFGIDFLRNGRKILQHDKRLFNWTNPNDPTSSVEVEYPIELVNQGGRLIGEIHLDYVPVHYDKTAFEYSDRGWKAAVDYLRGEAPLQPQKAKNAGYAENTSPLARLYKGFRRNDAGEKCLIPGDGSRPLHEETRLWARKYWDGDPDYETDQKWWEQVLAHDKRVEEVKLKKAAGDGEDDPDEAAVLAALGAPSSATTASDPSTVAFGERGAAPTQKPKTLQERLDTYRAESVEVPALTREYGLPSLGSIRVETRALKTRLLDAEGQVTPIWLVQGPGTTATAFLDLSHEAFTRMGFDPSELVLIEVCASLKVKAESTRTHAQIVSDLRAACLPDTAIDHGVIRAQATELVADIRQRMADNVTEDPQRALSYLDPDEQTYTESALIADGGEGATVGLGGSGRFLLYAPPLFLVKVLENWPEAFMEGRVFVGPYSTLGSKASRRLSLARIVGYLNDIATLLTFQSVPSVDQLRRTRLSVELLQQELTN
ncbi:MAG: ATP-binding protein [Demequinaceae bacterium]|nr:ATP-binding protein [Demequinaceae bacterium]